MGMAGLFAANDVIAGIGVPTRRAGANATRRVKGRRFFKRFARHFSMSKPPRFGYVSKVKRGRPEVISLPPLSY
jgi:hypothetical protein